MWSGVSLRERLTGIHFVTKIVFQNIRRIVVGYLRRISTSVNIYIALSKVLLFLVAYVTYTKRAERLLNYHNAFGVILSLLIIKSLIV